MKIPVSFWLYFFLTLYGFFVITVGCQSSGTSESTTKKEQLYIGSATCKSCHVQEYEDWKLGGQQSKLEHDVGFLPFDQSYATTLRQLDPQNTEYRELFRNLDLIH